MALVLDFDFEVMPSGNLEARRINGDRRYRKHFLATRGLGGRNLELDGDDLILLAGPVTAADGVAAIMRWRGAVAEGSGRDHAVVARAVRSDLRRSGLATRDGPAGPGSGRGGVIKPHVLLAVGPGWSMMDHAAVLRSDPSR